jgi:DNA-binding transcriptional LysR family regulator
MADLAQPPADLPEHHVVPGQRGRALVQELLAHDISSTLTVNNYFGVLQAVLAHLGIGVLPDYLIEDFPALERVLPDVESGEVPVFLAYPEELRQSKRVAAFRDFVTEESSSTASVWRADCRAPCRNSVQPCNNCISVLHRCRFEHAA